MKTKSFRVASLFEGKNYVANFENGELTSHTYGGKLALLKPKEPVSFTICKNNGLQSKVDYTTEDKKAAERYVNYMNRRKNGHNYYIINNY